MTQQFTVPGGREKGATLAEASDATLEWWIGKVAENLETGAGNPQYADRDRAWLDAARAEQARRNGGAPAQQSQQPAQGQQRQAPPSQPRQAPPQQRQAPRTNGNGNALAKAQETQIMAGSFADPKAINAMLEKAAANYNLVAPATVCGYLPEGCEVAVALVSVDLSKNQWGYSSGDVYSVGQGKLGISKTILNRISGALDVSWDDERSYRVDDGSDPRYCRYRVAGRVRNFDGTFRKIFGDKEVDLRDGSAQIEALYERAKGTKADGSDRKDPTKQIREMRLHIQSHAETKAKLRAIRELGIKTSFTEEELRKPFAVARLVWTGRTDDPALKRMFAEKTADAMLGSMAALYGGPAAPQLQAPRRVAPPPLPSGRVDEDDYAPEYDADGVVDEPQGNQQAPEYDRGDNPDNY